MVYERVSGLEYRDLRSWTQVGGQIGNIVGQLRLLGHERGFALRCVARRIGLMEDPRFDQVSRGPLDRWTNRAILGRIRIVAGDADRHVHAAALFGITVAIGGDASRLGLLPAGHERKRTRNRDHE